MKQKIMIKPLSQNEAFRGRKYKTAKNEKYVKDVLSVLENNKLIECDKYQLNLEFGLSNKGADLDNPVKIFQDCLQKKYDFNDSYIYKLVVEKVIVKKGFEYINFELTELK